MKYNYCSNCKKAYLKSRLEKDKCIYCGKPCETVDVGRNRLYYFGYAIMMLGAVSVLIPKFMEVTGRTFFIIAGLALAIGGAVIVMMGSARMAKSAAEKVTADTNDD